MEVGSTGAIMIALGVVVVLVALGFALRMTRDKPTARIAAMVGVVSVSLLTAAVVYGITRGLAPRDAPLTGQSR